MNKNNGTLTPWGRVYSSGGGGGDDNKGCLIAIVILLIIIIVMSLIYNHGQLIYYAH